MKRIPVILQIIPELGAGGAEQGCIDIAAALNARGACPLIACNGGSRIKELQRVGAEHINLPVHSKNPLVIWANIGRLARVIKKRNVDLLHVRSRAPAWSAIFAARRCGIPIVTTCHAPYNFTNELKRVYNSIMTKSDRVIAISETVAYYIQKNYRMDPLKLRVIHRGIALDRFHPATVTPERLIRLLKEWRIPDGANIVMMPGRLTRWKGHSVLIEAMDRLKRKDVFCVMIGSDQGRTDYRKEMETLIEKKGLGSRIRLVDHCDDMPAAYMLATVVVSASTDPEGFGRVPVEAQAMGRPAIATDHGGAKETIIPGQTGWLVEPGNAGALASAISETLELTIEQRAMLANRAMTHVAAYFSREQMAQKTLEVYGELLKTSFFETHQDNETPRQADAAQPVLQTAAE